MPRDQRHTSVEEQIGYGLDQVDPHRMVGVPLADLLYIHQTLGELVRFFHQPMHYETLEDVNRFLGGPDSGAFGALRRCYHDLLRDAWPPDVVNAFDEGRFDNPDPPHYFAPESGSRD